MKTIKIVLLISIAAGMSYSCKIVPPKLQLTGEKSVVERQLVGKYREIEDNAWAVSTVMTNTQKSSGKQSDAVGDPELFSALKVRELNFERVKSYKREGALGEANNGILVYKENDKYDKDADSKKLLMILLNDENDARRIIFKRSLILSGNSSPTEYDIEEFGKKFAQELIVQAEEDYWLQDKKGNWYRKK